MNRSRWVVPVLGTLLALSLAAGGFLWVQHRELQRAARSVVEDSALYLGGLLGESSNLVGALEAGYNHGTLEVLLQDLRAAEREIRVIERFDRRFREEWRRVRTGLGTARSNLQSIRTHHLRSGNSTDGLPAVEIQEQWAELRRFFAMVQAVLPETMSQGHSPAPSFDREALARAAEAGANLPLLVPPES